MKFPINCSGMLSLLLGLSFTPARAEVTLTPHSAVGRPLVWSDGAVRVEAGRVLGFQAAHTDGHPHDWTWTVDALQEVGTFTSPHGKPRIAWVAPEVAMERRMRIRATVRGREGRAEDTRVIEVLVSPRPGAAPAEGRARALALLRQAALRALGRPGMLDAYEVQAPTVLPFASWVPRAAKAGEGIITKPCMAWTPAGLLLCRQEHGSSLMEVIAGSGAKRPIHLHGQLALGQPDLPEEAFPPCIVRAVAACPPGFAGPAQVAVVLEKRDGPAGGHLCWMDLEGRVKPIGPLARPGRDCRRRIVGTLAEVECSSYLQMAVDVDGSIYLAAHVEDPLGEMLLRRVTPDGMVVLVAGQLTAEWGQLQPCRDGRASGAILGKIEGMVLDPETRNLYLADGHGCMIRRVTPDGEVTTLLGKGGKLSASREVVPDHPVAPWPADKPCLEVVHGGLALMGRRLLMADYANGNLLAFDLESRALCRVMANDAEDWTNVCGSLHGFAPYLPGDRCAHLHQMGGLFAADGTLVLFAGMYACSPAKELVQIKALSAALDALMGPSAPRPEGPAGPAAPLLQYFCLK